MSPRKPLKAQGNARLQNQSQQLMNALKVAVDRLDPQQPAASQLRKLHLLREQLERTTRATLQQARGDGGGWAELGAALNMSPQGAQQKAGLNPSR